MRFDHRRLLQAEQSGPLTPNSAVSSDFDTKMVVILAALLCALAVVLVLNILVRCSCTLRHRSEEQVEAQLTTTSGGRVLRQLPVVVYSPTANIPATECPICLGEFFQGEKIRVLPKCKHGFHVSCIDTWLVSHPSCPNCRHSLLDPPSTN